MSITDADVGRNIQRFRYLSGLTQSELADQVRITRTSFSRIENGKRAVTAPELADVAEALNVAISLLVEQGVEKIEISNGSRLFLRSGSATRIDDEQLQWFISVAEITQTVMPIPLLRDLDARVRRLPPTEAGELAARLVRSELGIGPATPIRGFSGFLYRLGLPVITSRFSSNSQVSGCLLHLADRGTGAVMINSNHPRTRQRFTLAHELGHYLFDKASFNVCSTGIVRPGPRSTSEYRADVFASALLLPRRAVDQVCTNESISIEAISRLMDDYQVSRAATVSRLKALNILSDSEARAVRKLASPSPPESEAPVYRIIGASFDKWMRRLPIEVAELIDRTARVVADDQVIA